jgi:UPF0716 protein FxsA
VSALLLLLFIVVPIAELAVIIQVGQWLGVWWTIALLILDSILGTVLARTQGRAAWLRFSRAVQAGRPPAREVLDGALVLAGALLLLTPGFITDIAGLALLIPPTRAIVRTLFARRLANRMIVSMTRPPVRPSAAPPRGGPSDIEGTATEDR